MRFRTQSRIAYYTQRLASTGVRLRSCSLFGIASESDVVGPGGDMPLLCLNFLMATRDKLKCRRRLGSFLPNPFICFGGFSDIV